MGRDVYTLSAHAALSRHNSPQDDADNTAWNLFVERVEAAAASSALFIDVMGDSDLPTKQWS